MGVRDHYETLHYGPEQKKNRKNSHLIIHCPTSEDVSERVNERCKRTSKQTSEWPGTSVWILGWSGPQCGVGAASALSATYMRLLRPWVKKSLIFSVSSRDYRPHSPKISFFILKNWKPICIQIQLKVSWLWNEIRLVLFGVDANDNRYNRWFLWFVI